MSLFLTPIEEAVLEEVLEDPRIKGKSADIINKLIDSIKVSTVKRYGYRKYEKKEAPGLFVEEGFLVLADKPFDGAIKFEIPPGNSTLVLPGAYLLGKGHPIFLKTEDTAVVLKNDGSDIVSTVEAEFQAEGPTMVLNQPAEFYNKSHDSKTGRFAPRGGGRPLTEEEEAEYVKGLSERGQKRYATIKAQHERSNSRSLVAGRLPNGRVVPVSVENEKTFGQKAASAAITTAFILGFVALNLAAASPAPPRGGYQQRSGGYQRSRNYESPYKKRDTPEDHRAREREKVNDYARNLREQRRKEKAASGMSNKDYRQSGFRSENGAAPPGRLALNP